MQPLSHPVVVDGRFQTGRFDKPFPKLNFLDADPGSRLGSSLRNLRLKEWQAYQFSDGRYFGLVALFDAKLVALVQAKVYDSETGVKHMFERKVPSSALTAPDQILDGRMAWYGADGWMEFHAQMALDRASVGFDLPSTKTGARLKAQFTLDYRGVEPVVVCLPFDERRAMYSQKGVAPLSGDLVVGDHRVTLSPDRAFGLLDDHRGYYPRPMVWDWLTCGGHLDDGTLWGLNLTRNQATEPERHNENALWIDGRPHPLGPVSFERTGNRQGDTWTIRDADGRVDLTFTIEVDGRVQLNLGVVESRYRGPFGRVTGTVSPDGVEPVALDGVLAMGERFWLKA
ncbi:MAG: DUF2804 domain-containing protein [Deltaproteobacteria bacterium]|nr:MAG: DUF2804 domain-containing protein [Deltaproteobacteria bacterium]